MTYKNHRQFYDDADLYDSVLWEDDEGEAEYYLSKASKKINILYLGTGTGRILKKLCSVNRNVVGVDISENMRKKSSEMAPDAEVINADVLNLNLKRNFELVIASYEFLNHFNCEQLKTIIKNVTKHLSTKGQFIAQLRNPYLCINKPNRSELVYVEIVKDNILEKGYITYDKSKEMYSDYIERTNLVTNEFNVIKMDWYYYFPEYLRELFLKQGIKVINFIGEFNGSLFNKQSSVLIVESLRMS